MLVQKLLNKHRLPPLRPIAEDGIEGPETKSAISEFQRRILKIHRPDGQVDPQGPTWNALCDNSMPTKIANGGNFSGGAWWHANQAKYPNSVSLDDLNQDFRKKVKEFLDALEQAGFSINTKSKTAKSVQISSTKRSKQRAYLMHYSWTIAHGIDKASLVPPESGVNINWDHGDDSKSKLAAQQMVDLFGLAHIAALDSRHIAGLAIDMTITWTGSFQIKKPNGVLVSIGSPTNGAANKELHQIGKDYGVIKLVKDAPHWSSDGK
jgi:hypothetical protein